MILNQENKMKVNADADVDASTISIDVGNLLVFDPRPLEMSTNVGKDKASFNENLRSMCTTATQILFNKVFALPVERFQDVIVAKLPDQETILPREKPLPKARALTKWQAYAKMKGIQKKKNSRMVYDPAKEEWRPRWGYKRAGDDPSSQWLVEIKKNEQDPNQDFFAKALHEKKERLAKNEFKRLKNISRSVKTKGSTADSSTCSSQFDKLKIKKKLNMAKKSDASMSKFSEKINEEDRVTKGLRNKRKFEANFKNINSEKNAQLKILDSINSQKKNQASKPKLNFEKRTNKHISKKEKKHGSRRMNHSHNERKKT